MLTINFWNILFIIIDILILYLLMKKFLFGRVHKVLDDRKKEIQKQYDDAAAAEKDANDLKARYENTMANIEQEKANGIAEAKKKATEEYDRIIGQANSESDKIVADARDKAKAAANEEKRKAEDEIVQKIKDTATQLAKTDSDEKLYDSFLNKVDQSKE